MEKTTSKLKCLSIIKCECGFKILVVPDLAEMSRVIELHADLHKKRKSDLITAGEEHDRIENLLTAQILQASCEAKSLKQGPLSRNQDGNLFMKNIDFLVEQGFAKKEKHNGVVTLAITDCGYRALRFFQNPMLT